MSSKKPTTIGLVGGIASGKSFVASKLVEFGAELIDADKIAHEILKQPLIVRRLVQLFGSGILSGEQIDRAALAALVFGEDDSSAQRLELLESVVHPMIHAEAVRQLRHYSESDTPPIAVVIDAPLLLEANWAPLCDLILFIDVPREIRVERASARGWSPEQFDQREARQLSLNEKRAAATHIIPSADEAGMLAELKTLWRKVTETKR